MHRRAALSSAEETTPRSKTALGALAVIGVFALALIGCAGKTAPDFDVIQFDGSNFSLPEQAGANAVVINFWFPSCPPCREEMPAFEEAWQELEGEPVRFLGLFVPQGFDSEPDAREFVSELGLTFSFATDRGARIANSYDLEVFPTTYFIDFQGEIAASRISRMDAQSITRLVRGMLADRPSS